VAVSVVDPQTHCDAMRRAAASRVTPTVALCLGLVAALLFVVVSSCRLTAQGMYYDELHQATAASAYGRDGPKPQMFARVTIFGLPVLNMNYSGALKTAIYGLFLRYSGVKFSVLSWRLLGIVLVGSALFVFCALAGPRLSLLGLLAFLLLLFTDATVILATRHVGVRPLWRWFSASCLSRSGFAAKRLSPPGRRTVFFWACCSESRYLRN
jgi:hypothetical protein